MTYHETWTWVSKFQFVWNVKTSNKIYRSVFVDLNFTILYTIDDMKGICKKKKFPDVHVWAKLHLSGC